MLFGLPEHFALESDIYFVSSGSLLGHLCLWADNRRIGSYEQNIVLQTPTIFIQDFLDFQGLRNHPSLDAKSDAEILNIIHWSLYSEDEEAERELSYMSYRPYSNIYRKCEVCPQLSPSFDGDCAVLLEYEDHAYFIWRAFEDENIYKVALRLGECQSVFRSFVDWIDAEQQVQLETQPIS